MSAPLSFAARSTFRPMRPNPLMPTRTGIDRTFLAETRSVPEPIGRLRRPAKATGSWDRSASRHPIDVAVLDFDEVVARPAAVLAEGLGDRHRAVSAAGAA